jgi:CubicO group peptidase (beta-lactamase class C family)
MRGAGRDVDFRDLEKVVAAELKETNTPGAACAIVSGDRVVYEKGFGVSDIETGAPVTQGMLFRTGSINKMLTAAVLVALADEGKIALDAPLAKSVSGLTPGLLRVTADQLLSHTAGLIDPARICCAQDEGGLATQVRAYRDEDCFFTEPGRIFSYSNTGYNTAGFLIEQLSGELYADAMQRRLFGPLGMMHTTFRPTTAMTFPLAQGHDAEGKARPTVVRPFVNNVGDWPGGYAYTNVGDLARFAIALMNGGKIDSKQVLAPTLLERLSKPWVEVPFDWDLPKGFLEGAKYGHGFFIQEHRGLHILHHGGTINGFGAFMVLVPEKRFAVIVMANKTGTVLGKATEKAMELLLPLQPRPPVSREQKMPMTQPEMEEVTGTYRNGNLRIDLFVRDGKLIRKEFYKTSVEEGPGHEFEVPVAKIGRDRFLFTPPGSEGENIQFTVIRGADGKPEFLHGNLEAAAKVTTTAP